MERFEELRLKEKRIIFLDKDNSSCESESEKGDVSMESERKRIQLEWQQKLHDNPEYARRIKAVEYKIRQLIKTRQHETKEFDKELWNLDIELCEKRYKNEPFDRDYKVLKRIFTPEQVQEYINCIQEIEEANNEVEREKRAQNIIAEQKRREKEIINNHAEELNIKNGWLLTEKLVSCGKYLQRFDEAYKELRYEIQQEHRNGAIKILMNRFNMTMFEADKVLDEYTFLEKKQPAREKIADILAEELDLKNSWLLTENLVACDKYPQRSDVVYTVLRDEIRHRHIRGAIEILINSFNLSKEDAVGLLRNIYFLMKNNNAKNKVKDAFHNPTPEKATHEEIKTIIPGLIFVIFVLIIAGLALLAK